jgi:hypothetical protein
MNRNVNACYRSTNSRLSDRLTDPVMDRARSALYSLSCSCFAFPCKTNWVRSSPHPHANLNVSIQRQRLRAGRDTLSHTLWHLTSLLVMLPLCTQFSLRYKTLLVTSLSTIWRTYILAVRCTVYAVWSGFKHWISICSTWTSRPKSYDKQQKLENMCTRPENVWPPPPKSKFKKRRFCREWTWFTLSRN